jgi:hypothetical protein
MTQTNVIPLHNGPMNESDYDHERARIREAYGETGGEARVRWEQALAALFHKSGWTQERLAKKEDKPQPYISRLLLFGRFLSSRSDLPNWHKLKEGRFRDAWSQTDKDKPERERFSEVERLLAEADERRMENHSSKIGKAIRAAFMDGKWHYAATIAKTIEAPEGEVKKTLDLAYGRGDGNATYKVERRPIAKSVARREGLNDAFQYRIFATEKKISSFELIEKLTPIIEYLRTEGKKNMATSTIVAARESATRLEKLLKEWTE